MQACRMPLPSTIRARNNLQVGLLGIHHLKTDPNTQLSVHHHPSTNSTEHIERMAREGLLNIVGGCCGTTPDHIKVCVWNIKVVRWECYRHHQSYSFVFILMVLLWARKHGWLERKLPLSWTFRKSVELFVTLHHEYPPSSHHQNWRFEGGSQVLFNLCPSSKTKRVNRFFLSLPPSLVAPTCSRLSRQSCTS